MTAETGSHQAASTAKAGCPISIGTRRGRVFHTVSETFAEYGAIRDARDVRTAPHADSRVPMRGDLQVSPRPRPCALVILVHDPVQIETA